MVAFGKAPRSVTILESAGRLGECRGGYFDLETASILEKAQIGVYALAGVVGEGLWDDLGWQDAIEELEYSGRDDLTLYESLALPSNALMPLMQFTYELLGRHWELVASLADALEDADTMSGDQVLEHLEAAMDYAGNRQRLMSVCQSFGLSS